MLICLITQVVFGQIINDRFEVKEPAKLIISSSNLDNHDYISGTLSSGELIVLKIRNLDLQMSVETDKEKTFLKTVSYDTNSSGNSEIPILELYEYDFNNDGNKEIIIACSLNINTFPTLEVFKHKETLIKRIGLFEMGLYATFKDNVISVYNGIRDNHINFIFFEDSFWQMNYHNPND